MGHPSKNGYLVGTTFMIFAGSLLFLSSCSSQIELDRLATGYSEPIDWQDIIHIHNLPELAYLPPPSATEYFNVSRDTNYCSTVTCGSLLDLSNDIRGSLRAAGFPRSAYFFGYQENHDRNPKVIIVTALERISASGHPARNNRFDHTQPFAPLDWSFSEIVSTMFNGREGRLRLYVIEVGSDDSIQFFDNDNSYEFLKNMINTGVDVMPELLNEYHVNADTYVRFRVYEYNSVRGSSPQRVSGNRTVVEDMMNSGIEISGFQISTLNQ